MTRPDLTELRRLAEAATPGWRYRANGRDATWMSPSERRRYAYVQLGKDDGYTTAQLEKPDAAYIAAASPDVILALLDQIADMMDLG